MIHYHGAPFSGDRAVMIRSLQSRHAMVSFAAPDCIEIVAEVCQSFCLDNGAYSVWKAGKELDVKGYAEWVDCWLRHPGCDWYCIPDSIEGDENDNTALIAQWRGLVGHNMLIHGVPVWHLHESLDRLYRLCHAWPRVAFGSSGDYAQVGSDDWWWRMSEAMERICDEHGRPMAKLHGLRMLDNTVFSQFPFSSCDSTNVARNIGIDQAWKGTYTPKTKEARALILMERIESHASASRWSGGKGAQKNMELFG